MPKLIILTFLFLGFNSSFSQSPLFDRFSIGDNRVYCSLSGPEGRVLFGTKEGLFQFEGLGFRKIDAPLSQLRIDHLMEEDGSVFAFSSKDGLFSLDQGKLIAHDHNEELLNLIRDKLINEMRMHDSTLWFSLKEDGGLYKFMLKNGQIQKHIFEKNDEFAYFIYEIGPKTFISGANEKGLFKRALRIYRDERLFDLKLSESINYKQSSSLLLKDGSLVFSLGPELIHIGEKSILSRIFQEHEISCLHEDLESKVWVGLRSDGLVCYPNGLEESSNWVEYLNTSAISNISENQLGELWFSTIGEGFYEFNQGTNVSYEAPLLFSDFDSGAGPSQALALKDIELRPANDFNPNALAKDTLPPQVFITGIRIMGEDSSILSHYDLPHTQNFIEINYLGFSKSSSLIQYRYKMQGINDDWVYTSRNLVQYTTLPPGNYVFQVEAVNKDGVWSNEKASLRFNISPPIWEELWFRALLLSLVVLISGGIWFWSYQRFKRKNRIKEAYNRKLAEVELQALRAQMNPHFLFNTLSSIQHFITLSKSEEAINYLSKFAKLMRIILENSQKPEISLKDELSALEIYLDLESLRFKDKFDYQIIVDNELDQTYDQIPPLLIQPYVENAIMHGIMHLKSKGKITVSIDKEGDFMKLSIHDNGVGREKAKHFEDQKMHKSRGMSITKDRLEIINSSRKSSLNANITDLKNSAGEAIGTLVEIYIPLED